jgi:GTP:adenosylcobinamide-phosphate guanylyltransferase
MVQRVVTALRQTPEVSRIAVCSEDAELFVPFGVEVVPAERSPSLSVRTALQDLSTPLLVTTADHALLKPEWVRYFLDHLPDASVVAAVARSEVVMAAEPTTKRTFLRFADGAFSGCNMFYFRDPAALGALDLWRQVEMHRKTPWRIAWRLGIREVLAYLFRRLTITAALERLSTLAHARAAIVEMPFGESAIDVDKPSDLALVETILARRGG